MRVELEFGTKNLGDFHCSEDARKVKDYGVRHGWDNDTRIGEQCDGSDEVLDRDRFWANLPKIKVFPLEFGFGAWGRNLVPNIERFRGKEEVEDALHAVSYSVDPVYPLPAVGVVCNESHNEGAGGWPTISSQP